MASLPNLLSSAACLSLSPSWSRPSSVAISNFARYDRCRRRNSDSSRIRLVTHAHDRADSNGNSLGRDGTLVVPWRFGLQPLIAVFAFGFLDAGYSGDWSRIGVLSQEAEATLRLASYVVVPACLALVWLISKGKDAQKR